MLSKLKIDFEAKENELIDEAAKESDDVVTAIKNMRNKNIAANDILNTFDEYTQARIKNAANIARVDTNQFIDIICSSPVEIVRPILAKTASRTVFQEKLQFDVLSKQSKVVSDLVDLPNGGKNALYIEARKSVDFVGYATNNVHRYRILIAAKYTKNDGGSQDNQRNDLIDFAEHAPKKNDDTNNDIIVLLSDGPYYTKSRSVLDNKDFFSYIDTKYFDRRVIATTTEDFDMKVGSFIETLN